MKYGIFGIVIVFFLAINVGFFGHLKIFGAAPNLLLLLVIAVSLQDDYPEAFFVALLSGFMLDVYTGVFFGSFSFSFVLTAFLVRFVSQRIAVPDMHVKYLLVVMALSMVFIWLYAWLYSYVAARLAAGVFVFSFAQIRGHALAEFLYNSVCVYPVMALVQVIHSYLMQRERKRKFKQ